MYAGCSRIGDDDWTQLLGFPVAAEYAVWMESKNTTLKPTRVRATGIRMIRRGDTLFFQIRYVEGLIMESFLTH